MIRLLISVLRFPRAALGDQSLPIRTWWGLTPGKVLLEDT